MMGGIIHLEWLSKQITFIFIVLVFLNLVNFIDRGIIPGSTSEFNDFILHTVQTSSPDVYIGLLQSMFVIGFIIGAVLFGHMVHYYGRFYLTGIGCSVWLVAVLCSGLSRWIGSYRFLLISRALSGFGEAGLQCAVSE